MHDSLIISIPRMHAELSAACPDAKTFWPGLPQMPSSAWSPVFPLSPAQAAASLRGFESACRDGASGTPVHMLASQPFAKGLSPSEIQAIDEMTGTSPTPPSLPVRCQAQQILLLAWLKEQQSLELAAFEAKIKNSKRALSKLLAGRLHDAVENPDRPSVNEDELPAWNQVMAAILAFLSDIPEDALFLCTDSHLAALLSEACMDSLTSPFPGMLACSISARRLSELCKTPMSDILLSSTEFTPARMLTMLLPQE